MELQSIAYPVEGLSLAGDQDTDLSNDIQPTQIVCKKEFYNIQYRTWVGWLYTGGYILNRAIFANTVAMMKAIIIESLTHTLHFDIYYTVFFHVRKL